MKGCEWEKIIVLSGTDQRMVNGVVTKPVEEDCGNNGSTPAFFKEVSARLNNVFAEELH